MNNIIYEKNIQKIQSKYSGWAEFIEQQQYDLNPNIRIDTDTAIDGTTIFRVSNNGTILYLNGKYNPSYAGMDWLNQIEKIDDFATVIIIGIHDAIHIKNILKKAKSTTNILIYEPSLELFLKALEETDLTFLFEENIPVGVIVDEINTMEQNAYLSKMVHYDNMTSLKIYISGNYDRLFPQKVSSFIQKTKKHIQDIQIHWNTTVRYTNVNAKNIFNNCTYMYNGYSISSLFHLLPPNIPTIIVSAGPSLNKNIQDLKAAVGKANIIATDTALKPLLNAGIIPNFFVIVDGLKPGVLFKHKDLSKVPLITMNAISVEPMQIHKGKKFFYNSGSAIETEILKTTFKKTNEPVQLPVLETGGSVATSAFSLGIFMGSRTIILMGQDLAMTNNQTHADGTFKEKMDQIDVNSKKYFEIESINGGKVLTRNDFKRYLDWFEEQIKFKSHIRVIDATEGGAKIHGAEVMTLKEAIEKTCTENFNVRYKVSRLPKMFSEPGKEEFLKFLENMPTKLMEVKKKSVSGLRQYEKLEKLSKKKHYSQKELEKVLKQLKKTNKYMETDYMANVVNDSLKGIEFALRTSIYKTQDDIQDEMKDIAQNGKVMLQAMQYAIDELLELAENTVIPFAKKQREKNAKKAGK